MAKSASEVIAERLSKGVPLSQFAVHELRRAGNEAALRVNASNVVRAMLEGRPISGSDLAEAEAFFPDKVSDWKAAGGRVAKGKGSASRASVDVPVTVPAPVDSGTPLASVRREQFAQAVARGEFLQDAYREAYPGSAKWSGKSLRNRSSKLAAIPEVAERILAIRRAAADATVIGIREFQERLTRRFRTADAEGDVDAMVKVGTLLAKCVPDLAEPAKVEVRNGGVTDDYRPPPAVARMADEELRGILLDEP